MTETHSCEVVEAVFAYGPLLCGVVAEKTVKDEFDEIRYICDEHFDQYVRVEE